MAKSYAVYHTEKGNISSGGIGNHIDRTEGMEHSYIHADPERKHLNEHLELNRFCTMKLSEAINERISEGYTGTKAIRKDAVKYSTHIMSGSHDKMKEIENDPAKRIEWIKANLEFIKAEFGEKNIVRFAVHRDEKTMHIHAVTVNLTKDGRLSAKEIIGNKKVMQERQDRYAAAVQKFGLMRGERNTGIKHEDAKEYYKRIQSSLDHSKQSVAELEAKRSVLGVDLGTDKENTIENLKTALIAEKTANREKDNRISKLEKDKSEMQSLSKYTKEELQNAKIITQNMLVNRDIYEEKRDEKVLEIAKEKIFPNIPKNDFTFQNFLLETERSNLKENIKKDLLKSLRVKNFIEYSLRKPLIKEIKELATKVLNGLQAVKFRSPLINAEISKWNETKSKVESLQLEELQDRKVKGEMILKSFPEPKKEVPKEYQRFEEASKKRDENQEQAQEQEQKKGRRR